MQLRHKGNIAITLSFVIGLILAILPLPRWALWFIPPWLALIVVYWIMAIPHRIGLGIAWVLGLLLDVLYGSILGEHAFALVLVAFITLKIHRQIRVFPVLQQAAYIFFLMIVYQLCLLLIQGTIGELPNPFLFWLPALTGMLIWPWVFSVLREWRRYYQIQ